MMYRSIRLALIVSLALVVLAAPVSAEGVTRELAASAQFRSDTSRFDPGNPCIETLTEVQIEERTSGSATQATATIEIREFDTCVVDDLGLLLWHFTIEPLSAAEYSIRPSGNAAALDTTIEVCNLVDSDDCLDVRLDLTWTATGKPEVEDGSIRREAVASGTITEAGRDLAPQADPSAEIERQMIK